MSEHTPGPWLTNGARSPVTGGISVFHKPFGLGDIAEVFGSEGDARLIAAAPTMYEYIEERAAAGDERAAKILEAIHASR